MYNTNTLKYKRKHYCSNCRFSSLTDDMVDVFICSGHSALVYCSNHLYHEETECDMWKRKQRNAKGKHSIRVNESNLHAEYS